MIPLKSSKDNSEKQKENIHIDLNIEKSKILSQHIKNLVKQVDDLNRSLKFLIWNWTILIHNKNDWNNSIWLKPIFDEIKTIADEFKQHFSGSIENLLNIIIHILLENVKAISKMWIDIMDRNLYERANDCRWWALTAEFQNLLTLNVKSDSDIKNNNAILLYINSLYTVYSNLFPIEREYPWHLCQPGFLWNNCL